MRRGDIILESNKLATMEFMRDADAANYIRRHQRHEMLDTLMGLDGIPFHEAMARIERWDETQHRSSFVEEAHLPPEMQTTEFRLRVLVNRD